jgi:hypothetical protein
MRADERLDMEGPVKPCLSERELKPRIDAESSDLVQSGATGCMVGGAGFEPATSSV